MENTHKTAGKTATVKADGVTEKATIKIDSRFDRMAIDLLKVVVPGQKMYLEDGEGHKWWSECQDAIGYDMSVTIIRKDSKVIAKIIYDYDSDTEREVTF